MSDCDGAQMMSFISRKGDGDDVGGTLVAVMEHMTLGDAESIGSREGEQVRSGFVVVPFVQRPGERRLQQALIAHACVEAPELRDEHAIDRDRLLALTHSGSVTGLPDPSERDGRAP